MSKCTIHTVDLERFIGRELEPEEDTSKVFKERVTEYTMLMSKFEKEIETLKFNFDQLINYAKERK